MNAIEHLQIVTDFGAILEQMTHDYPDERNNYPWIITFSGGKDSTLVAHLVFELLLVIT